MMQNKIALVTGGNRGLGKDMVINLTKKGLDVIFTYNTNTEEAEAVVQTIQNTGQKAFPLQLNVSDIPNYDRFFENLCATLKANFNTEKIDFFINNAGFIHYANFADVTGQQFNELADIHFRGPFFLTQKLLPMLNDNGGIVNISTGLTRFATPGYATYAAMKSAMETVSRYQAQELGVRKIRVNIVAPGAIETDIQGGAVRDNPELNKYLASMTALGRVGLPDDIGAVVAFLCTNDAKWINAQRIEVSGGMNL